MNNSRTSLRRSLIEARNSLDPAALSAAGESVVQAVLTHAPEVSGTVASYLAYGGELDAMPATRALIERGWRVVLPVCGPKGSMEFCTWQPGDALRRNRVGIEEPTSAPVDPSEISLLLVPGVGFDAHGSRIGHGMGFYDRYLERCFNAGSNPLRMGLAHDVQIVELPAPADWDVPMNIVLTPTQVIDP